MQHYKEIKLVLFMGNISHNVYKHLVTNRHNTDSHSVSFEALSTATRLLVHFTEPVHMT